LPILFTWLKDGVRNPNNLSPNVTRSLIYEKIMKWASNEIEGRSIALRIFMHLVGDVHQPLHATSRWTKNHPKGDKGGNKFLIKRHKSVKNLHSLWDSGVFAYTK
jgi:hypothetical protein